MGLVGGALNLYFIYKFIRILTTPFESTDAFKLGIIDEKGKILKKSSKLKTEEEKEAYTMMHRLVWKMKRLMEKIPFGKSRLASYAAALWLIKEEKDFEGTDQELQESFLTFLESDWKEEATILKENYEGDMDKKSFSSLRQEGIDIKKASMNDVIKDFQSSDAPQFKGKSDKKKKEMAIAAKLSKEEVKEVLVMGKAPKQMNDNEKLKVFNKLKSGDTIKLWYDSSVGKGTKWREFKVGRKSKSKKFNLEKISMQMMRDGKPGGVKWTLYNRQGRISLAWGDMAVSLTSISENVVVGGSDGSANKLHRIIDNKGKLLGLYKRPEETAKQCEILKAKGMSQGVDFTVEPIIIKGMQWNKGYKYVNGMSITNPDGSLKDPKVTPFEAGSEREYVKGYTAPIEESKEKDPEVNWSNEYHKARFCAPKGKSWRIVDTKTNEILGSYSNENRMKSAVRELETIEVPGANRNKTRDLDFNIQSVGAPAHMAGRQKYADGPRTKVMELDPDGNATGKVWEEVDTTSYVDMAEARKSKVADAGMECQECDHKFRAKLSTLEYGKTKCPQCKSTDIDFAFGEGIEEARRMPKNVRDYMKFAKGQGPNPEAVLDVKDVDKWVKEIKKGIKAGWVSVASSALGGDSNIAIMIKLTLEKESDWPHKILHNASFGMIRIDTDGGMEMFASGHKVKNMRKTSVKSARDVVSKINTWIKKVDEEVTPSPLKSFNQLTEKWRKGKYKVTDSRSKGGKVLGTFNSGAKAQKFVDDLFQSGDYEALTVELIDEGHIPCPECDGSGCKHCDGKGYHISEMPNRKNMEKINTLLKDYHGKFKWRDEVLYVTKEIEKDVRDIISKDKGHSYMVKVSKNPMREEVELVTEGRPKQDDDYVPAATGGDKLRAQLLSTQKRQYSAKDIESMARKYKVKLDGDPIGGKQWGGDWQIALKGGITMEYQYGPNSMYIKGWKFDRKAIKNYIAKYANEHETPRDYAPMGGKVLVGGFESAFELISEELLMEGAPANSVSGGNVNLDPFKKKRKNAKVQTETFGGKKVFVVSPERFYDSRLGKSRYARYEKYVGNDKLGEAIRQYGLANPKAPIILKNSGNGAMLYLKYGK